MNENNDETNDNDINTPMVTNFTESREIVFIFHLSKETYR